MTRETHGGNPLSKSHKAALSAAAKRRWTAWRERHPGASRPKTTCEIYRDDVPGLERLATSKAGAVHTLLEASKLLEWHWSPDERCLVASLPGKAGAR